jgi:hypothetical protein
MNAQHTPGPWRVCSPSAENGRHEIYAGNQLVAQSFNWMLDATGADYAIADAALIAAAPELLEALKCALRQLETLGGARRRHAEGADAIHAEVLEYCDAAIAKAEAA